MKKITFRLFSIVMLLASSMVVKAEVIEATVGDLNYEIDTDLKEATVIWGEYEGFTDLVIPANVNYEGVDYAVTAIGDDAFRGIESITSVTLPNTLVTIGAGAFWDCSLTSVTIPASVESIGEEAFWAFSLEAFKVDSDNSVYCDIDGVLCSKDKTELIFCPIAKQSDVYEVPNTITKIAEKAFDSNDNITKIIIPSSVTEIGANAMGFCTLLKNISVASDNPAYCDIDGVLFNKDKTKLCQYLGARTTKEYVIPETVTTIGEYAFYNSRKLTSVIIPKSVSSIETSAFQYCKKIASFELPEVLESIGNNAFASCEAVKSFVIPNSVTSIGRNALQKCRALQSVTIGSSVNTIGRNAFTNCNSLTSVICLAAQCPVCENETLVSDYETVKLSVPTGSVALYQSTAPWSSFANIEGIEVTGIETIKLSNSNVNSVFNFGGMMMKGIKSGLNIIRMENGTTKKIMIK